MCRKGRGTEQAVFDYQTSLEWTAIGAAGYSRSSAAIHKYRDWMSTVDRCPRFSNVAWSHISAWLRP
jgi:hypothetical protein